MGAKAKRRCRILLGRNSEVTKISEACRRKLGVSNRVLGVLVPEISLQRSGVVAQSGVRASAPPPRQWLHVIIDDGDDEVAEAKNKERALAEHVARHPEDVGHTVEDFNWMLSVIVRPAA